MVSGEGGSQNRRYGGVPADERRVRRREQFLAAAVDLIGTDGYRALRIRPLCARAGLTDRYFYEEFGTLEDVLSAVYAETMDRVFEATMAAVEPPGAIAVEDQARQLVDGFIRAVTSDVRRARIQLIEVVGVSPRIEAERQARRNGFGTLLARGLRQRGLVDDERIDVDLTCIALVGAFGEMLVAWLDGGIDRDVDALVAGATGLLLRAFGVHA